MARLGFWIIIMQLHISKFTQSSTTDEALKYDMFCPQPFGHCCIPRT